jgi:hypothetical protein
LLRPVLICCTALCPLLAQSGMLVVSLNVRFRGKADIS